MRRDERARSLVSEIREYCAAHADARQAARYARYFKEGYDAWGLMGNDHPFFNEKQAEWLERFRGLGLRGFLKAGALLFESGKFEEGAIAIRFVARQRDRLTSRDLSGLAGWFAAGIGNWAHVDGLCSEVLSPLLAGGSINLEELASWRASQLKYQRRAVPVAMLGFLKTPAAVEPLLEFIRPMMLDPERVVQQGLGWFLRESWKRQPRPVEAFLLEFRDTAPRLIFQYATEKMTPAARSRFRRVRG